MGMIAVGFLASSQKLAAFTYLNGIGHIFIENRTVANWGSFFPNTILIGGYLLNDKPLLISMPAKFEPEISQYIEGLNIKGASRMMKAYSSIFSFLENIELSENSDQDYIKLKSNIQSVISELEKAREYYYQIKAESGKAQLNHDYIAKFKKFDYADFCSKNSLNDNIVDKIKETMEEEKSTALFDVVIGYINHMLEYSYSIKTRLEANAFPREFDIWNLSRIQSESHQYGSYLAQIFREIEQESKKITL